MNMTSKTRHGLKAILDIAYHHRVGPVQRRHIAARQNIPTDCMDQILMRLRAKGLIQSLRGREGGYHLALEPEEINVWDIVDAVEDHPTMAASPEREIVDESVSYAIDCITGPAWESVEAAIKKNLSRLTLDYLLEQAEDRILAAGLDPFVLMESKPAGGRQVAAHG